MEFVRELIKGTDPINQLIVQRKFITESAVPNCRLFSSFLRSTYRVLLSFAYINYSSVHPQHAYVFVEVSIITNFLLRIDSQKPPLRFVTDYAVPHLFSVLSLACCDYEPYVLEDTALKFSARNEGANRLLSRSGTRQNFKIL